MNSSLKLLSRSVLLFALLLQGCVFGPELVEVPYENASSSVLSCAYPRTTDSDDLVQSFGINVQRSAPVYLAQDRNWATLIYYSRIKTLEDDHTLGVNVGAGYGVYSFEANNENLDYGFAHVCYDVGIIQSYFDKNFSIHPLFLRPGLTYEWGSYIESADNFDSYFDSADSVLVNSTCPLSAFIQFGSQFNWHVSEDFAVGFTLDYSVSSAGGRVNLNGALTYHQLILGLNYSRIPQQSEYLASPWGVNLTYRFAP